MSNFILVVQTIFGGAWRLFQTQVPGFVFTYADIILALLLASAGWALLKIALGFGVGLGLQGMISSGRSVQNPSVALARKDDEK